MIRGGLEGLGMTRGGAIGTAMTVMTIVVDVATAVDTGVVIVDRCAGRGR